MDIPATIEVQSWRQICDQKIESLISMERILTILPENSNQLQEELRASNILAPKLCLAIRRKDVFNFVSVLEEIATKDEMHVSVIVEQVSRAGNTILHFAAYYGSENILVLIAVHFPQLITKRNIKGDTILHVASRTQNLALISIVLSCYTLHYVNNVHRENDEALWMMKNEHGNTALHEAVMTNNVEAARPLFTAGEDVAHFLNKEGKSPLFLAVENGYSGVAELLLKAPFQNRERHQGSSPLHAAILARNSVAAGQRTKHNAFQPLAKGWLIDVHTPMTHLLKREASEIQRGPDEDLLKKLVRKRPELIYMRDQKGGTPLHCAASVGYLEGVGTIINASSQSALEWNTKGYLPIHIACKKGHVNVVKELVQQRWFDPMDSLNQKGQNILHIAAKSGKDEVVKYILREKKLEILLNEKDKNGNTPLHLASKYLYPKVLLLLIQEEKLNINLVNNEGLTVRDTVLQRRNIPPTFREFLSFAILKSIGAPLSEKGRRIRRSHTEQPQIKWIKGRVGTILLVAILVATVTFAAGFTMPGGVYSSDEIDPKKRGMATLVNRKMFQVFTICDAIAMYSSTMGSFILLYAQLGDFHMAFSATYFALSLVGLALVTMSVAFMAGVHLVVSNLSWLADIVMIIGIISLLLFLGVYTLLILPIGVRPPLLRHLSYFTFWMMIQFSESYGNLTCKVAKKKVFKEPEKDKDRGEHQQRMTER